ncbi:MAG: hypothetical protein R2848_00055 [Thermomicrobiales bacterium]
MKRGDGLVTLMARRSAGRPAAHGDTHAPHPYRIVFVIHGESTRMRIGNARAEAVGIGEPNGGSIALASAI